MLSDEDDEDDELSDEVDEPLSDELVAEDEPSELLPLDELLEESRLSVR